MGEQQVFAVINWWYDPQEKAFKVNVPRVCSSKRDAVLYVNLNKVQDGKKWEIHTTVAELAGAFNFSTDITPNYK
jgi:hypothetical protein